MIISLASHNKRLINIFPVIDSIIKSAKEYLADFKLILNVAKKDINNIPKELYNYENVTIYITPIDLKSHNKYYWSIIKYDDDIITLDDDVLYSKETFKCLLNYHKVNPNVIITTNGLTLDIKNSINVLYHAKYNSPSHYTYAAGHYGILYPKGLISKNDIDINELYSYLKDDDLYLKLIELRKGIKVWSPINITVEELRDPMYYNTSISKEYFEYCNIYRTRCYNEVKRLLSLYNYGNT